VLVVLALASTAAAIKPWTSILEQHLAKAKPIEKTVLAEKEKKKEEAGHGGGDAVYHWGYGEKNGSHRSTSKPSRSMSPCTSSRFSAASPLRRPRPCK